MEEARSGRLIDGYWIFHWIVFPLIFVGLIIGIIYFIGLYFDCPYVEDVSSCFPYNLPTWLKIISPVILIIIYIIILIIIHKYTNGDVE